MWFARFIIIIGFVIASFFQANARDFTKDQQARPKIGLVLGGGGAKGLAHVGVIKVLEENQIPVDVVTGTSMGAIVGALYASGYSADELENIVMELDWNELFTDETSRSRSTFRRKSDEFGFLTDYKISFKNGKLVLPQGLIQGQNLFLQLSRLLSGTRSVGRFDNLPIPFRLVATDLATGKAVILKDGDLASAVFASMAIPGLVPPVERNGRYLIDGGLVNNVPVDLARDLGADIIIAVDVGTDPKNPAELSNFVEVLRQTQIVMTLENTKRKLESLDKSKDVLITPNLGDLGAASFSQTDKLIDTGIVAMQNNIAKLLQYKLDDNDWLKHIMARLAIPQEYKTIARIEIKQNSKLTDEILRAGLRLKPGDVFNPEILGRDIDKLYGNGIYEKITYRLETENDNMVLHIDARVKESADGYFKFGVQLDSNLENESSFKLGVSYTKPIVNAWGGEWRTELNIGDVLQGTSEFYQPIGASQRFFIEPSLFFEREKNDFFDNQNIRRGEVKTLAFGASLQGGVLFGRWGELRGGLAKSRLKVSFTDKTLLFPDISVDDSYILGRFSVDRLDSLSFPTQGGIVILDYEYHNDFFGGDTRYEKLTLNAYKPFTKDRHTFGFGTALGGATGPDANVVGTQNLGGFLSLSGFSEDELSGQYSAMAFTTYYYRLNRKMPLFDLPLYVGGSLEAGNVFQDLADVKFENAILAGSLFAGMKSPLGPVFVGAGYNDKGNAGLYFSIGSFF